MSIAEDLILFIFFTMLFIIIALKQENLKQKDFFIKTLSHDFRVATLAQLRGVELLARTNNFDLRQTELIGEINKSCRYSLDMISMLINTYTFEKGKQIINYESFILNDILKSVYNSTEEQLKEKNIEFYLNTDKMFSINADKELVYKLLLNLLSTAISYSESNTKIVLTPNIKNNILECSLTYQGRALSEEECARMFSQKNHFSTVGHGIKMYLSKKIIDFHKGKIWVEKYSEKLNSFTFQIPQKKHNETCKNLIFKRLQIG